MSYPKSILSADKYTVRHSRDLNDPLWDSFLDQCEDGHHEQTSLWAQVKYHYGWESFRIIVSAEGKIVGGVQILKRRMKWIGFIGYISRGPVVMSQDPHLLRILITEMNDTAQRENIIYLAVVPSYANHQSVPLLREIGFIPKPDHLPPSAVMGATLSLDLANELDQMLGNMRNDLRRNLRCGLSSGFTFREGGLEDVETFRNLMWALCERRSVSPSPPQKDFFLKLWEHLHPHGYARVFLVEKDDRPVSAVFTFTFGQTVRFWKIGWSGEHEKKSPNAVLYWEVIKWSKQHGFRFFDFVSIDLETAQSIVSGDVVHQTQENGMSFFKVGFGGQVVILPEPHYKIYIQLVSELMKRGGDKVLASNLAHKAVNTFLRKTQPLG